MTDKKLEELLKEYRTKSNELAKEESMVDLDISALTWDEPKSYYEKLTSYTECEDTIEKYLKDKYHFSTAQVLIILNGAHLDDVLSGKVQCSREKEIELFVKRIQRRSKKLMEELGK